MPRQKNEADSVLLLRMDRHILEEIRSYLHFSPELNDMIPLKENETIAERLAQMKKHISNRIDRNLLVKHKELLEILRPKENCEEIDFIQHDCLEGITDCMIDEIDSEGVSRLNVGYAIANFGYFVSRIMDMRNEKHETLASI